MSAFCLATSSSCTDAIHHFQRRRLGQIHRSSQGAHGDHQHTTKTFKYYVDSLRTTKLLLGQDMPRALQRLQQTPILQDAEVLHLDHLDLNTLRMLMPHEIQTFTPYVKKSVLSEHDANTLLERWSEEAFATVKDQLTTHLNTVADTSAAFQLRQELLSVWLQSCFSTLAHADIVGALRSTFNEHIKSMIQAQISGIANIATRIVQYSEDTLENIAVTGSNSSVTIPAIWSPTLVASSLTKTAKPFLTQIQSAHLGGTPPLVSISTSLTTWCISITTLRTQIASLTQIRWQDSLEEPDDTDEDTAKLIIQTLSTDDPTSYTDTLASSLDGSITSFQDRLSIAANASTIISESLFLLRAIREATIQLSHAFPDISLEQLHSPLPHIYTVLASVIVTKLAARMEDPRHTKQRQIPLTSLPADLPSPPAFNTLRTLCAIMLEVGGIDTWTPTATKIVKKAILLHMFSVERRSYYLRNDFDEIYLRTALGGDIDGMEEVENGIRKAAVEYWGRTRLLFGVLDP
jgi:hypothetical protein